jgi:demethylmenaquinone methyltransferase/2-methoxy-6-polyprenyl-1,4-benzoquinol methylase
LDVRDFIIPALFAKSAGRGQAVGRRLRRRYYDLFARVYDRFVAWHTGEATGPMRRALAERAVRGAEQRLLDLCCGTGAVTRALRERLGPGPLVAGVDFSAGMLGQARGAAEAAGSGKISWIQADATALPFRAGSFDVVTCAYALYELKGEARRQTLDQVCTVLAPSGRFLAMEHEVPTRPLSRVLFFLRLAVIGAEGARAFLGGELDELRRVFTGVSKELVSTGKSKILSGTRGQAGGGSQESGRRGES